MKSFLPKIIISLFLIFLSYYLFFLKPQQALYQAHKTLSSHRTNLIQNRLAITQLSQLQPDSSYLTQEQAGLLKQLQATNQQALEDIKNQPPVLNKRLQKPTTNLFHQTQTLLQDQQSLITQLQATNNLQSQQNLIKSSSTITLLTQQTNLILQYDNLINQINQSLANLLP